MNTVPSTIAIDARIINSSTGRYVERLLHYLEEIDTTNRYFILVRKKDIDFYHPHNPHFSIVEADFADYSFGEQLGFAWLLYRLKPDLVHFCMPQQPLLYTRAAVTTVHDLNLLRISSNDDMGAGELAVKKYIFRQLLKIVARRSQHIICPSHYTKDDLVRFSYISASKVSVTYEGADVVKAQPQPITSLANQDFLLYVGRAEPYKNNRGLIKAHQQLLAAHPKLRLVIVGKKDALRQVDSAWVESQGYKQIDFLGFVSNEALAWLYGHCRAYVFPSFMEGFGLPGLEAMGYGAPVVSSNATCLPEIYQNGAYYFDPHTTSSMAAAINDVLTDATLRQQLIKNGQKVHTGYSWQRMAEQTVDIYRKVVGDTT